MGHSKVRKSGRKGVNRSKLLPLPVSMVQAISLQNHLALQALRSRHGARLHAMFLFRAVYLTYILSDGSAPGYEIDILHQAEVALSKCSQRAEIGGSWELADPEIDALKMVLTLHDGQLESIPMHFYETACAHLLEYLVNGSQPVIPNSTEGSLAQEHKSPN